MALNEDQQTEAIFKSARTDVDPVSGNDIPPGSLPEEVRDDIPAMLSEGEYVVPADVLRYYGMKFFEDLRSEAKMGLAGMEANGRIGGEPVMDDLPFSDEELSITESDEEPLEMNRGGAVGFATGGMAETQVPVSNSYGFRQDPNDPTQVLMDGYGSSGMGGYELITYYGPNGETVNIPFFNGMPLGAIPPGYTQNAPQDTAVEKVAKKKSKKEDVAPTEPETEDYSAMSYEELEKAASGMRAMSRIATGVTKVIGGVGASSLVNAGISGRYNNIIEEMEVKDPEKFESSGFKRADSIFGGESGLFDGLQDSDGSGKASFGDTWLGDLLGFDGGLGVQGADLAASKAGARRTEVGGETTGGGESRNAAETFASAATGSEYVVDSDGTGRRVTTYDPDEVKEISENTYVGGR